MKPDEVITNLMVDYSYDMFADIKPDAANIVVSVTTPDGHTTQLIFSAEKLADEVIQASLAVANAGGNEYKWLNKWKKAIKVIHTKICGRRDQIRNKKA